MDTYEIYAGQKINYSKSEISGSSNLDEVMIRFCGDFLNTKVVQKHSKYLGLPLVVGQNKVEVFRDIEDKVQKKNPELVLDSSFSRR